MRKIYYLSTCSTCQRILKEWNVDDSYVLQDIKTEKITGAQVDQMIKMAGGIDEIFSKRSMKYRAMELHKREIPVAEMRQLIIDEYTFLKRPVLILDDEIFVGNAKNVVEAASMKIKQTN